MTAITDAFPVTGACDPHFEAVRDAFADNFVKGLDVGASVAVTIDGARLFGLKGRIVRRGAD